MTHYKFLNKTYAISDYAVAKPVVAILVFALSLVIGPHYINGDQIEYRKVYEGLKYLDLKEGYLFYTLSITSKEFVHFLLSWMASRFLEKDLFIAISNAFLAYCALSLFQKWKASILVAVLLVTANFYFVVLYFSAERLKYGFIFLALSMIYIDQVKRSYIFGSLALISHVQVIIVYASILFRQSNVFLEKVLRLLRTGKVSRSAFFILPVLLIATLPVADQIFTKFQNYYGAGSLTELAKILLFLLLALWYSNQKSETFMVFVPMVIAVFLVGGDRINLFGYFAFLYYGFQFRGGLNWGVLGTSAYFAYASIGFIAKIFEEGTGF